MKKEAPGRNLSYLTPLKFLSRVHENIAKLQDKIYAWFSSFTVRKLTRSSFASSYTNTRGCKLDCVTYHALPARSGKYIFSSLYWISLQALKQNSHHSVCHSALAIIKAVAEGRRRLRMESKANKNSHVLMFGLSFNLILTLGSLGFSCYSLHRLDSRLTTLEQNSLLYEITLQNTS